VDKREVLFAGEEAVPALVEKLMAETPPSFGPMAVIASGVEPFARKLFEGRLKELRMRRAIIHADAGLRERELQKRATLSEVIRQGFIRRSTDELTATLTAEIAVMVFSISVTRWLSQDNKRELSEIIAETFSAL
jgi:hypothetical protein